MIKKFLIYKQHLPPINIKITHHDQEISHIKTTPSTTTFSHIHILKNASEHDWNIPYFLFHYVDKSFDIIIFIMKIVSSLL